MMPVILDSVFDAGKLWQDVKGVNDCKRILMEKQKTNWERTVLWKRISEARSVRLVPVALFPKRTFSLCYKSGFPQPILDHFTLAWVRFC